MSLAMGQRRPCQACGEELIGALTVKGNVAPITVAEKDNGNVWLGRRVTPGGPQIRCMTLAGPLLEKAREQEMPLHLNHFAECPAASRFSRAGM